MKCFVCNDEMKKVVSGTVTRGPLSDITITDSLGNQTNPKGLDDYFCHPKINLNLYPRHEVTANHDGTMVQIAFMDGKLQKIIIFSYADKTSNGHSVITPNKKR